METYYEVELHDDANHGEGKPRYTTTKVEDGNREIIYTSSYKVDAIDAVPRNNGNTKILFINCNYADKTYLMV